MCPPSLFRLWASRATKMSRFVSQVLGAVAAALVLVHCSSTPPANSLDYKSRANNALGGRRAGIDRSVVG